VFTTQFANVLKEYDMDNVFQLPTIMEFNRAEDIWIPGAGVQSVNLFKQYNKARAAHIRDIHTDGFNFEAFSLPHLGNLQAENHNIKS
jgi:hypothetical protein